MAKRGEGRTALVTGASGGIGAALARLFAADGYDVALVSRGQARLEAVAEEIRAAHGVRAHVVAQDLAEPGAPAELHARFEREGIPVDVLVNNAGFGLMGPFVHTGGEAATDVAREMEMIQLNVAALVHLSKLFLPGMVARGRGGVLNVASTAAFQPGPEMAVYYATKAFVVSFGEALRVELEGTGVHVSTLCPGPTETAFAEAANMHGSGLFAGGVMDAETVARIGYDGFHAGRGIVITGLKNRVMAHATRLVPRGVAARIARKAQARRKP